LFLTSLQGCDNGTIAVLPESSKYLPSDKWAKALALALQSRKGIVESAAATALVCLGATDELRLVFGSRETIEVGQKKPYNKLRNPSTTFPALHAAKVTW